MTTAIPTGAVELEEMLGDTAVMSNLLGEPGRFGEFVTNYAKATMAKDDSIALQVREQVQAGLADMARENGLADRPNVAPHTSKREHGAAYNKHAAGAQLDGKFEHTGELLQALYQERIGNRETAQRLGQLRNDFSSSIPSEGGFLIPEEFRAQMLQTSLETAIVRPRARVIPMSVPRIKFPMIEDTNHVSSVYGGIVGYWSEEGAQLTASSAKFGAITLDAQKLTGYTTIPNELLADSAISVGAFVDQSFPTALSWFEDDAFIRGNGVGQPVGFLTTANTAAVAVAKESDQTVSAGIKWENIVKMYARMLPTSLGSAVWIANIDTFPALATMALNVGTGGQPVWLDNGVSGAPMTILGRPVIFTEKAETLGAVGDINFVDLSYYLIGDRQQMTAMTSEHFKFDTDTTAYRIIQRVDGRPWLKNPITPRKGAGTLSPFVKLAARP